MALSSSDAAHLLRRTGFGVTPQALTALTASPDRATAIERVLDVSGAPTALMPAVSPRLTRNQARWTMTQWWMERMRTTPTPIVEKMTMFWHNHFVSALSKVPAGPLRVQNQLLRQHALGDYHDLVQSVSVDPAMLVYLDNWRNLKGRPQENFARELMELFTLGVGHFTEKDVAEMARAWTAFCLSTSYDAHQFWPAYHDTGNKQLFGLAPRPWTGPEAVTEILRGVKATESSEFITAKLFSYLAYPIERTDPVVVDLARQFRASGLQILALLRSILSSDAFWSVEAKGALVRSPVEWMVAGMQAVGGNASSCNPSSYLPGTGQAPFDHPGVDGWKQNSYWISTSASWGRSAWSVKARAVAYGNRIFDGVQHLQPAEIAQRGFDRFGIVDPSPQTRSVVEQWAARTIAEGDRASLPANLAHLLLLSPDFQLA